MPVTGQTFQDNLILHIDANWDAANKNLAAFETRLESFGNTVQATNKVQAQGAAAADKAAKSTDKQAKSTQKATKAGHEHADSLMSQSHSFRRLSGNISTGSLALDEFSMRLDRASMFMWRFNIAMIPLQQIQFQLMAVTAAMGMLEVAAINTYRAVDRMQNTFMGMGDSAAEAGDKVDFLLEKAKTLPFTFEQVSAAAMAFKTSGIAETKEELDKWLNSAADLAAAASTEQGRDIARAAEAMVDAVNGEIRRLRDTYHVSSKEIAKYGEDASDALHALISDKWGGTAEKQMQSLEGSISNFLDSLTRLGVAFGENLKEPLMVFLGIGQDVVEMLTDIVKMTGGMGLGWAVIAATAVPALGAMAAAVARIYMQIQGLRGGYKILTRDMGSLFHVIARLTAAMNDLAVAEANELAVMEGSELALKEQVAERNRLIATLEAQGAATAGLTSRVAAHRAGADVDIAQKWHSGVMRRAHAPMMPGGTGAATIANLSTVEKRLLAIGNAAKETTIPMGMYQKYLDSQGKSLGMLTKAEHVYMLEESKRLGILRASGIQTDLNTGAEGALTAARKAQMTVIGEQILLEQRRAKYMPHAVLGTAIDTSKGVGVAAMSLWQKREEIFQTGMRKVNLALHSTTGAMFATVGAGMAVVGTLQKMARSFEDARQEAEGFAQDRMDALEVMREEGKLSQIQFESRKQYIEALKEELALANKQWVAISWFQAFGFITYGVSTALGYLLKDMAELEKTIMSLEAAIEDAADATTREIVNEEFTRPDGTSLTSVNFMGRTVTREEADEAVAVLEGVNPKAVEVEKRIFSLMDEAKNASDERKQEIEREIATLEKKYAVLVKEKTVKEGIRDADKTLFDLQARTDESVETPRDTAAINEARLEKARLLEEEARARRTLAIINKDETGLKKAEEDILRAVNEQREIEIDLLQKRQNVADSEIGYLRATYAADDDVINALKEKQKVHDELADKYKASGDMAQYYQNKTAALKAEQEAALIPHRERLRLASLEANEMSSIGHTIEETAKARMKEAEAMYAQADALEYLGQKREAEEKRQEGRDTEKDAAMMLLREEADQAGARADEAELRSSREDRKLLDPKVYEAKMRAAHAELRVARAEGVKSGIMRAENKILELRKQRVEQAEKEREEAHKKAVEEEKAMASAREEAARISAGDLGYLSPEYVAASEAALDVEQKHAKTQSEMLSIENKRRKLAIDVADARREEYAAILEGRYKLAQEYEERGLFNERQVERHKQAWMNYLEARIAGQDKVSEKIRLQTELIKLQKDEAEGSYDDIVRRILGGADVVEEAISTAQLVTRFGPDAIRGAGITSSAAVRVVGSDRSTLTIEIGKGSINRLKDALSGAAADAFTRSFIEDLVKRVR